MSRDSALTRKKRLAPTDIVLRAVSLVRAEKRRRMATIGVKQAIPIQANLQSKARLSKPLDDRYVHRLFLCW